MAEPLPETIEEARRRAVERMRQQAANGHAPAVRRSNGHAPSATDPVNWAQIIGQQAAATELRFEREIATLREHVITELAAKPTEVVATGLSDDVVATLAKAVAAAVNPLAARINKLEQRPRREDGGTEWICAEPNTNDNRSCDECGSCGPRMRSGPILLNSVWLSIAKRLEEFLCSTCMQQRCRDRLGRELTRSDLRGCDANRSWSVIRRESP